MPRYNSASGSGTEVYASKSRRDVRWRKDSRGGLSSNKSSGANRTNKRLDHMRQYVG